MVRSLKKLASTFSAPAEEGVEPVRLDPRSARSAAVCHGIVMSRRSSRAVWPSSRALSGVVGPSTGFGPPGEELVQAGHRLEHRRRTRPAARSRTAGPSRAGCGCRRCRERAENVPAVAGPSRTRFLTSRRAEVGAEELERPARHDRPLRVRDDVQRPEPLRRPVADQPRPGPAADSSMSFRQSNPKTCTEYRRTSRSYLQAAVEERDRPVRPDLDPVVRVAVRLARVR